MVEGLCTSCAQVVALKPNNFSFNAAISCAADGAQWPLALGLLEAMSAEARPNVSWRRDGMIDAMHSLQG